MEQYKAIKAMRALLKDMAAELKYADKETRDVCAVEIIELVIECFVSYKEIMHRKETFRKGEKND